MAWQCPTGELYVPSDVLVDDEGGCAVDKVFDNKKLQYEEEVNNMLATILETKRDMETTVQ